MAHYHRHAEIQSETLIHSALLTWDKLNFILLYEGLNLAIVVGRHITSPHAPDRSHNEFAGELWAYNASRQSSDFLRCAGVVASLSGLWVARFGPCLRA